MWSSRFAANGSQSMSCNLRSELHCMESVICSLQSAVCSLQMSDTVWYELLQTSYNLLEIQVFLTANNTRCLTREEPKIMYTEKFHIRMDDLDPGGYSL